MSLPDRSLLDLFVARRDEAAFRSLVDKYLDHVHSVARRVTGSDDLARDVAQSTFVRLAERAAQIPRHLALPAWLHQTSRSLAIDLVRAENRRREREASAADDFIMSSPPPEAIWSQLAPVIDELVDRLPATYRDVVLSRFYHNHPHSVVAEQLGLTEEAARKRATRALDKLRVSLSKRGITTTSAALATLLPAHAATPAPSSLAAAVTSAACSTAPVAAVGGSWLSGFLKGLAGQKAVAAGVVLVFSAGLAGVAWQKANDADVLAISSQAVSREEAMAAPGKMSLRGGVEKVVLDAEGRRERLKVILAIADMVERRRELIAFLDALPPGAFEEVGMQFFGLGSSARSSEFSLMMLAWGRVDLPAALSFSKGHPSMAGTSLMAWWAEGEPEAALKWAAENPMQGPGPDLHLAGVLEGISRTDLPRALSLAEVSGDARMQREQLRWLLFAAMARDKGAVAKFLELTPDEGKRRTILGSASLFMAGGDPQASVDLLSGHPEALSESDPDSIYNVWVSQDLAGAKASLEQLPEGTFRKGAVAVVAREIAIRDPRAAFDLLESYPEGVDDATVLTLIDASSRVNLPVAVEQIPRIFDEVARNAAYVTNLNRWLRQDEAAARAWIRGNSLPESVTEKLSL